MKIMDWWNGEIPLVLTVKAPPPPPWGISKWHYPAKISFSYLRKTIFILKTNIYFITFSFKQENLEIAIFKNVDSMWEFKDGAVKIEFRRFKYTKPRPERSTEVRAIDIYICLVSQYRGREQDWLETYSDFSSGLSVELSIKFLPQSQMIFFCCHSYPGLYLLNDWIWTDLWLSQFTSDRYCSLFPCQFLPCSDDSHTRGSSASSPPISNLVNSDETLSAFLAMASLVPLDIDFRALSFPQDFFFSASAWLTYSCAPSWIHKWTCSKYIPQANIFCLSPVSFIWLTYIYIYQSFYQNSGSTAFHRMWKNLYDSMHLNFIL